MSEWISVDDRLPQPYEEVLVFTPEPRRCSDLDEDMKSNYLDHIDTDWLEPLDGHFFFAENKGEITHWRPLLELPK